MSSSVKNPVTTPCRGCPVSAGRILLAVCRRAGGPSVPIRYAPADWFSQSQPQSQSQSPTPAPAWRKRWSRWTRRLAEAGLLDRLTEPRRNRVTAVCVTEAGWRWVQERFGPGALVDSECEPLSIDEVATIEWESLPLDP